MNNWSSKRVCALFKYDWMLEKRRLGLILLIVLGLYTVIGWYIWWVYSNSWLEEDQIGYILPPIMLRYCTIFFAILFFCSVFIVTPILQRKFAKPQTATAYLTLPGTTLEKYTVMLSEYLLGFIACIILYVVCFYLTALLGSLIDHPQYLVTTWDGEKPQNAYGWFEYSAFFTHEIMRALDWVWNFADRYVVESGHSTSDLADSNMQILTSSQFLVRTLVCVAPFSALLEIGYYLVLNMFFRAHGQIKSIACFMGTSIVLNMIYTWVAVLLTAYFTDMEEADLLEIAGAWITNGAVLLWFIPVLCVGMYYWLYRLMATKQAK